MIRRIISFALHQPLFILLAVVFFIGAGLIAFNNLPIEAFPDVSDTQVTVITLYPGRAAEEVEKQVTTPLEVGLAGLPNALRMFSHTQFGLSYLIITFSDKADAYFARQQVTERLRSIDLPTGVQPELAALSTAVGEIYRYRLQDDRLDSRELRSLQDWVVTRQLLTVSGVADVVSFGGLIKQHEVHPNLAKMKDYKISLQQLFAALQRANVNTGGGYVEHGHQQYLIRGIGLLNSVEDISNVVVTEKNGTPVLVKDIAEISVGNVPRQGAMGQNQENDIVSGLVLMRKGENPPTVLAAIKERVAILNQSVLPKGVQIVPFYDRTWLLHKTLKTVFTNLVEGALLVSLVLFLFLGNFRAAAVVALVIPLSLLATFLGLTFLGIPANLLSLGAMDFGIIVDGAVIIVENIFRELSALGDTVTGKARANKILEAAVEVGRPTLFSMLIIIAAHIPIFTLQRHEGKIFAPMAYSVTSALIGSLLMSLTLVPLLCYFWLRRHLPEKENWIVMRCKKIYEPVLAWALKKNKTVFGVALFALVISLLSVLYIGTEFLPELNEGSIWINLQLAPSISLTEASNQCAKVRTLLKKIPEVNTVISKLGRPEDGTDPKLISMTEFLVNLKPESEWRSHITKNDIINEMEQAITTIPSLKPTFSQPVRDNILESISQIDGQIVIKIFGDDLDVLHKNAQDVLQTIAPVRGVARAFIDRQGELPELLIEINRTAAARYGLNIADIQDVIEIALAGKAATQIWEGEKRFAVVVRLKESERAFSAIQNILLSTADGQYIPLSQVASFKTISGNMNISHEDSFRVLSIGIFIRDRDMGSVVADMQALVKEKIRLPEGYRITWSGEFENQERAMTRLAIIVPISILLIFILLFDAFQSVKSAFLIILNVPFALIGGILALLITGIPLSVSAAIGFIALFGQAVLNGVVMVSHFNQLKSTGISANEAVMKGSITRLRTILMTALLAMLGLLPMALSTGIGSETQKPLAVVVIGGLLSATLLTLLVLPALYLLFFKPRHERRK